VSKDVSALNRLWVETEDVVDGEDSGCGIGRACASVPSMPEMVVCYAEVSEEANMSLGHRGQCIALRPVVFPRRREGCCVGYER
jgi:hypothetical protein